MTLAKALEMLATQLTAVSTSATSEAYLLLEALTGLSRSELLLRQRSLTPAEAARLQRWLERRLAREPLQHITGTAHFYGLELSVSPDVLIPRPETERLVELALTELRGQPSPRVLDVGTGSGAVALAILHERPDAVVLASDISAAALRLACSNAERCGLELSVCRSDLLGAARVQTFARELDVLVANLPYLPASDALTVSPEVARDPALALYSGADGLNLTRRLLNEAFTLLAPGTRCLLELDPRNVRRAAALAGAWASVDVIADLVGRKRFLRLER